MNTNLNNFVLGKVIRRCGFQFDLRARPRQSEIPLPLVCLECALHLPYILAAAHRHNLDIEIMETDCLD